MSEDVLGWLLPDAPADEKFDVRRVITALRLLREDARGRAGPRAAPSWQSARKELESLERRQRRRALDGLLQAQLSALRASESFLDLGPCTLAYHEACLTLLQTANPAGAVLPPTPAEAPLAAVERLLAAGVANGASPEWRAWWCACARHVTGPAAEAERGWEALLRSALEVRTHRPFHARVLVGLVAAHLDRFQPARAWALRERHAELALADPSLRRLFGWSALFCGHEAAARLLLHAAAAARLPAPLLELRADRPDLAALLPGADPESGPPTPRSRELDRGALGALVVGVFKRGVDGGTEILALDAPDELRPEVVRRCQAGWESLLGGENLRRSRSSHDGERLPDALAGKNTRALASAAIRHGSGELAGWIQLESAHQLLPSAATMAALARAWSDAILAAGGSASARVRVESELPLRSEPYSADDPRGEFARRLFSGLAPAGGLRMAWIEPGPGSGACVRAERGGVLTDRARRPGGAAILRRVRAERDLVRHRGERHEALHSGASRGFALPLLDARGARVLGVLVLESARSEALTEHVLASARAALRTLEPLWWSASFRAGCRAQDGRDHAWELCGRFLASLAPALQAAAASRAPFLLVGPRGAGRRTLARWLHFRGSASDPVGCEGAGAPAANPRVLELTDLAPDAQRELARAAAAGERFFLAATAPAHVLCERGLLAPALERVLDPLPLLVPPLRARRDEIPALVRVLADNVVRAESLRPARFDDGALGALWRQDWRGNVSELGALVAQLARTSAGRELGAPDVRLAMHSRGLGFRARLPSLRPSVLDLELALATTRHRGGSENLARAARYLGWDPDTLRARLEKRGAPGRRTRASAGGGSGGGGGGSGGE